MAKLAAGRENDIMFVRKVFQEDMVDRSLIKKLCKKMPLQRIEPEKLALLQKRLAAETIRFRGIGLSY